MLSQSPSLMEAAKLAIEGSGLPVVAPPAVPRDVRVGAAFRAGFARAELLGHTDGELVERDWHRRP